MLERNRLRRAGVGSEGLIEKLEAEKKRMHPDQKK
jgi:hypothetical protein